MVDVKLDDYLAPLPLVAVLRGITPAEVPAIADALTAEGFRMLEVPLNSPDPFTSIRALSAAHGASRLVGAGTVIDVADVARVREAGGRLIVMPHADVAVVREAITEPPDGLYDVGGKLLAQASDEHLDSVRIAIEVLLVQMLDEFCPGNDAGAMQHEISEHAIFMRGKLHRLSVDRHPRRFGIEAKLAAFELVARMPRRAPQ